MSEKPKIAKYCTDQDLLIKELIHGGDKFAFNCLLSAMVNCVGEVIVDADHDLIAQKIKPVVSKLSGEPFRMPIERLQILTLAALQHSSELANIRPEEFNAEAV